MICYSCDKELIWGGDHNYEDCGVEGDGIVSNLSCPNDNCNVQTVVVYMDNNKKQEDDTKSN